MERPRFPPQMQQWLPGDITQFQLPFPKWLMHRSGNPGFSWLPLAEMERLEKAYGYWATRRAESMAPVGNVAAVEAMAKSMAGILFFRYGPWEKIARLKPTKPKAETKPPKKAAAEIIIETKGPPEWQALKRHKLE